MNNKTTRFISIIVVLMIVLIPTLCLAQPDDPGGDPGAPIDGGASLLVGAAAVYGIKKLKDRKAKQNKTE